LNNNINNWRRKGEDISDYGNRVKKGMNMRHCWKNVILPVLRNRREAPLRIL
jgi:hypothetical protein